MSSVELRQNKSNTKHDGTDSTENVIKVSNDKKHLKIQRTYLYHREERRTGRDLFKNTTKFLELRSGKMDWRRNQHPLMGSMS